MTTADRADEPALQAEADRQLALLLRGTVDCVQREELRQRLVVALRESRPLRVKLGFDPTSSDLHLGHAVVLRKLRQFQELGHHAVLIVGGATAMLGDPSGKDKTRPQLSREQVEENARTYLAQAGKVLSTTERQLGGRTGELEVRSNADWFQRFGFADFIRLCSRMTVARMVERDSFTKRMREGSPIGIHEFIYPLMQGHDSVEVRSDVELGGTDQLFNLLVGRDLQGDAGQRPQVCMTTPLIPGLDGKQKMSKSLGNYVGLTFPADDVFGKVMSIPDALMALWYETLTDDVRVVEDPAGFAEKLRAEPRAMKAQLAESITAWLHDAAAAAAARARFDRIFREKEVDIGDAPLCALPEADAPAGRIWIVKLLVQLGFAASNGEARRLIQGRGVKLDGALVEDDKLEVDLQRAVLVQAGKRRIARAIRAS